MLDSREPTHIQALRFGGVPTVVATLEDGDLWASTADGAMLVVERKTPSDLLSSIKDGRLFQQAAAMRQRSQWAYLAVTGVLTDSMDGKVVTANRTTGWRWEDVQGALLTVQELGVMVVHCRGDEEYEEAILRLARRERTAEKPLQPRTNGRVLSPAEVVLTSLPGIGLERAQTLLAEWDNRAGYALAWLTWLDTWHEIASIGNGTKANVRRALGLGPEEWLAVHTPEAANYAARHMETTGEPGQTEQPALVGV
jgi:ERCC4-type nuclease